MEENSKDLKYIYINVNFQFPYSWNFDQYSDLKCLLMVTSRGT